ncbi:hypothetical protein ABO04_11890 [Nitrosomonas sp. HPC101]|nr:hypothetical protein [Nitrosomonas sp. HPC101]
MAVRITGYLRGLEVADYYFDYWEYRQVVEERDEIRGVDKGGHAVCGYDVMWLHICGHIDGTGRDL